MADQRERMDDPVESFRTGVEGVLSETQTALPGIVQDFDPKECTCSIQVSVQVKVYTSDGKWKWHNISLLTHVPVVFPHGKGFALTFPISKDDEALVVFSSRCYSAWWDKGGIQIQDEMRLHDIGDGFAIVGPFSRPKVLQNISTDTVQLRNQDGSCYLELAAGGVINIVAPGGLNIKGTTVADKEGTFNGHTVGAHTHIDPQGGVTGTPTG
jgi:hypothetical protein